MSKRVTRATCYMCKAEATSSEHVPAKCFFPDDVAYRKQLITVPSCTLHNEDTSKDDEYVRNIVAMCIGNNPIAYKQFLEKTVKSFKESIKLFKRTTGTRKRVMTNEGKSYAFQIERDRFEKVFRKMAYALFFHEFHHPWDRELIVMTANLRNEDMSLDEYGDLVHQLEPLLPPMMTRGSNPDVFQYAFLPTDSGVEADSALHIRIYGGFHVRITVVRGSTVCRF